MTTKETIACIIALTIIIELLTIDLRLEKIVGELVHARLMRANRTHIEMKRWDGIDD